MTLEGSKHVVEHKLINYSCVYGGIFIITGEEHTRKEILCCLSTLSWSQNSEYRL
jgi:hypothetical protein